MCSVLVPIECWQQILSRLRGPEITEADRALWEMEAESGFCKEKEFWGSSNPGIVNSFHVWSQLPLMGCEAVSWDACVSKSNWKECCISFLEPL